MIDSLSPSAIAWLHRLAVLGHIGAVVVWFGAVAYYLLVLRPALRTAGLGRQARYALLRAVRARLKRVVGVAVVVLIATGFFNAWLRGLLGASPPSAYHAGVFHAKLAVAAILVLVFLTALPLLRRVQGPRRRGRLFVAVHIAVLTLGVVAAALGVVLAR